jgi:hypothetical protein
MSDFLFGSINLSKIPKELIKEVKFKDGSVQKCLDIKVCKRREPSQFGDTHFISCEPKDKNERKDGVNYFIGDLKEYTPPQQSAVPNGVPAPQSAPPQDDLGLPF